MADNHLTLAYLIANISIEEQEAAEQALKQRISTLRPSIEQLPTLENLDSRRRIRRPHSETPDPQTPVSESLSAYRPKLRGQQPYCSARLPKTHPRAYRTPTPAQPCICGRTHTVPNPKEWQFSAAEEPEWDYDRPNGGHPARAAKVAFANPIVTEVNVFERWYADAYGKWRMTTDPTSEDEDEEDVRVLEYIQLPVQERLEMLKAGQCSALGGLVSAVSKRLPVIPATGARFAESRRTDDGGGMGAARGERPKIKSLRKVSIRWGTS